MHLIREADQVSKSIHEATLDKLLQDSLWDF